MKLTLKQQRFVDAFDGNATAAARAAGYKGSDNTLGVTAHDLLRLPKIQAAIAARKPTPEAAAAATEIKQVIATREERQAFWTSVMQDITLDWQHRLKASELLAKSGADFVQKVEVSGKLTLDQLVTEAVEGGES